MPPYNFINDDGEVDGFERELGDELCARAELTCEWVTNDWDSIIPNLVSGNYDTIMAGMSITDERQEVIAFSRRTTPQPDRVRLCGARRRDSIDLERHASWPRRPVRSRRQLHRRPTPRDTGRIRDTGRNDCSREKWRGGCGAWPTRHFLEPVGNEGRRRDRQHGLARTSLIGGGIGVGLRQTDEELKEKFDDRHPVDEGRRLARTTLIEKCICDEAPPSSERPCAPIGRPALRAGRFH